MFSSFLGLGTMVGDEKAKNKMWRIGVVLAPDIPISSNIPILSKSAIAHELN